MLAVAQAVFWAAGGALALVVGYLLLLTAAAAFARRATPGADAPPSKRFLFLIPAHNEERLLPTLLESLRGLDYPAELVQVHVVADNCTDGTADLARAAGAVVHERHNTDERGKPYALRWALGRIWASEAPHDAVVILDADTLVSANFLRVMGARLARGERAVQSYYAVRDAGSSWGVSLRAAALAAIHYLRPQGRMVLGGSAGLKGNGMVFAADVVRRYEWPVSLTEDIEYHMALILGGERVTFAPDALVWAEMPGTLAASRSQHVRWERGRTEMVRRYVLQLLGAAVRRRSFLLLDAAVEQLIPPFSIVAAGSVTCLAAAAALQSPAAVALGAALVAGQALYVLAGLLLSGAPRSVYLALLYAPALMAWKVWLYVRVIAGLDRQGWVRTARNGPE